MKLKLFLDSTVNSYNLNNELLNVEINQVNFKLHSKAIQVVDPLSQQPIGNILIVDEKPRNNDKSWLITKNSATTFFAELQSNIIQYLKWEDQLSKSLSYKQPVKRILQVLQQKVINPLLIFDSSLKLLGHSSGNRNQLIDWQKSIRSGYISVTGKTNPQLAKLFNSTEIIYGQVCRLSDFKLPFYLQKIILRNNDHFYMIIVLEEQSKFQKDLAVIQSVTDKIAATVGLHNFPYQSRGGNLEGLLRDILVRPNISINEIQNRLQFDPHRLKRPLRVLCLKTPYSNLQPLGTILTKFVVFHYEQYDVYIIEDSNPTIIKTIIQELETYLKSNNTSAGISNTFTRLHQFNQFYQQAVRAIKLGKSVGINEYHNYIAADLIDHISQDQSLRNYLSKKVLDLKTKDQKLFKTLKTFLINRENKKETAIDLQIHRSTLNYRLNKIEEKYSIELTTSNQYLYTLLSTLLID
ncbi:PucR family transcriptional regulator [Limosilactobacillus sp.]|jgi:hypothetical protein|uniref:PucR family transcriptional regulator n=1 Tax=Limosilactobacillus sp. TaxID=2773925 RepID=UPI0025C5184A|nr:helix-turn-helix domain-containing protein [Limosilactobacillus sp.]MCI2031676.1 helix-turn-helix domain-containing protein [Limosilactobacillus sp.]